MKKTDLSVFTNKYQLTKTLRFELKPIGVTLDKIKEKRILEKDEERAEKYKKIKKIIDDYHKDFIERALQPVKLNQLERFAELYYSAKNNSTKSEIRDIEKEADALQKIQAELRKEIVNGFKKGDAKKEYAKLFKKELITELLTNRIRTEEEQDLLEDFKTFTTYFTGLHENRKNMYTDKEQSTAIAYRLVHENLPKFLDNVKTFEKIKEKFGEAKVREIEENLEPVLQGYRLSEIFTLEYYNNVLTQNGIMFINTLIGGYSENEGKVKVKGLNEYINLFNQEQDKNNRLPKLKKLYKQILSDRQSVSFLPETFESSQEVLEKINNYYRDNLTGYIPDDKDTEENVLEEIKKLLADITSYDLTKIYIRNGRAITDISKAVFGDWSIIKSALEHSYLKSIEIGKKGLTKKQINEKEKFLKKSYFSIEEIELALLSYKDETELLQDYKKNTIANYFRDHFLVRKEKDKDKVFDLIANVDAKYSCIKGILNTDYPADKKLYQDPKTIADIKAFLDSLMEILHFIKPLALPPDSTLEKDEIFYSHFDPYYQQLEYLIPLYNKVRNYATQKPYSTKKIRLNFENKSKFLDGWVDSYTEKSDNATQAGGYLFRRKNGIGEYDYYVGFSSDVKLFRSHLRESVKENDKSDYERLDYYQLKSASVYGNSYAGESYEEDKKKLFASIYEFARNKYESLQTDFDDYIDRQGSDNQPTPSGLIRIVEENHPELYDELLADEEFKKINSEVTERLKKTILSLKRVPKSQEYNEAVFKIFTEPIKIIEDLSKEKTFDYFPVSKKEFEEACNRSEKPLYLFKISNKDLSFAESFLAGRRKKEKRGKDNLHTMYFKALMAGNQNIYDIGSGAVFYRKKSIDNLTVHKPNEPIDNKNPNASKKQSVFEYDIVKDRRFTVDKFQFHLSIVQNYQATKNPPKDYNYEVLNYLKDNPDVNIIGLDRGERHLIYLTLINQKGEILKQESLNTIVNEKFDINTSYHTLLDEKEKERDKARKNWHEIESIKELKEGYLSQVVHKIAKMMVEYNAIVVMEDLNFGFKRGRFKVEKQIYQKLEKMLIDKLNYLVLKDQKPNEPGGIYRALQLTNKFESFQKLGKQSGFLFYVPAWFTSKIDPTTGFVNLFYTKYESIEKAKDFFSKFKSIRYNSDEQYFEFAFDYRDFTTRGEGTRTTWTVCTYGDRVQSFRNPDANNSWDTKKVNLTQELEDLFGRYNIIYGDGSDIKEQITDKTDKVFFKELLSLFKLTLQLRNSIFKSTKPADDYLISPVKNASGEFYDSRKANATLPQDADANGAYHIAKKGLWILEQINAYESNDWRKLNLAISNNDWLKFAQNIY